MEGFKANPKMKSQLACFKEGGYVTKKQLMAYEKKEDKAEEKKDIAEDKKIVKKAIGQHEAAQHKGAEKTEIKLKHGGRAKKSTGTVRKYKTGGVVGADGKGEKSGDEDKIKKVKEGSKKAAAPSKGAEKPAEKKAQMFAGGKRVPKFFNEEPDSDLSTPSTRMMPKKRMPKRPPMAGLGNMSDMERQTLDRVGMGAGMGMGAGLGSMSDAERQAIMQMFQGGPGVGAVSDYEAPQMPGYADGGPTSFGGAFGVRQPETADGMGQATPTGGMGNAASMGAPSDQERNIMRGLAAIGSFCYGGKVK